MAVRVYRELLPDLLNTLKRMLPVSLPIYNVVRAINQCQTDESEVWVNRWPEVEAVLIFPSVFKPAVPALGFERRLFATNTASARNLLMAHQPLQDQEKIEFADVRELLWPVVTEIAEALNHQVEPELESVLLYLPESVELPDSPRLPDGLSLGSLKPRHAKKVHEVWAHRLGQEGEVYLKGLIEAFVSVAIFEKASQNLVAWIMTYENGAAGHLYVYPAYRGLGLAKSLVIRMSRAKRDVGETPYGHFLPSNTTSINMHKKLGFEEFKEKVQWMICMKQDQQNSKL